MVAGGGVTTFENIVHALANKTPVLVISGTGRMADIMAYAWRFLHDSGFAGCKMEPLPTSYLPFPIIFLLSLSLSHAIFPPIRLVRPDSLGLSRQMLDRMVRRTLPKSSEVGFQFKTADGRGGGGSVSQDLLISSSWLLIA